MANKRKVTTAIVAVVTAVALLLGGTFAWQSINQTALNEASDVINPGGRLHDDFNGSNKDVYVENFADEDIFARIRLDEYFEIIMNKGNESAERVDSIAGEKDADGNIISWETHKFDGNDATAEYWEWATGGSTIYMPTFNMNKDSLVADINGTYQGQDGIVTDEATDDRYTDYVTYEDGESKPGTEIYDADTNQADEVGKNFDELTTYVNAGNIATVENAQHTAQSTLGATLISMADWMALPEDEQVGEYWVYDTDGWVYWAQPIKPGTATGKLLDSIKLSQVMDDSWYYAINVVAQFVTADDLGKTDGTGFYDTENGTAPSDNALALLEKIGVTVPRRQISVSVLGYNTDTGEASALTSMTPNSTMNITVEVLEEGTVVPAEDYTVEYSVENSSTVEFRDDKTTIVAEEDADHAVLNASFRERAEYLTVNATVTLDDGIKYTGTGTVPIVVDKWVDTVLMVDGQPVEANAEGYYEIDVTNLTDEYVGVDLAYELTDIHYNNLTINEVRTATYHALSTPTVDSAMVDGGIYKGYVGEELVVEARWYGKNAEWTNPIRLYKTEQSYRVILQLEIQYIADADGNLYWPQGGELCSYLVLNVNPAAE